MAAEERGVQRAIIRSPFPDVHAPDVPLPAFVLAGAEARGDHPALIDGATGRALSYRRLLEHVRRAAVGLRRRGFGKGDVFAIYSPNLPEYPVLFLAVAAVGGINTTINPLATASELAQQLTDSGAVYLATVAGVLEKAREAATRSGVREIFVFDQADGATPFDALLAEDGPWPDVAIDPAEDLAVLPYSSGTTGFPKGVMLTHRNLVINLLQTEALEPLLPSDVLIGVLPFFHIYGQTVIMNAALYHGATIVTMARFDLEQFLELMQRYRVTIGYFVPPIVLALAKSPLVERYDLSALRRVLCGAAPLSAGLEAAFRERLSCVLKQGYGLTETSPVTHANPTERIKAGSIGPPLPNTECLVVDIASGEPLGRNQRGEIWIRGPQVMKGYLNRPDATAATIDRDGWLHTGDVGYADDDGYFYVVDRVKELIKYKGLQVAPAELEAVLVSHPAIADAAVIGAPDEEAGEIPKAFVTLKAAASPDEIMSYVAERVAPYKKIRRVEVLDQIPKSASGKILRRVLLERERARAAAAPQ